MPALLAPPAPRPSGSGTSMVDEPLHGAVQTSGALGPGRRSAVVLLLALLTGCLAMVSAAGPAAGWEHEGRAKPPPALLRTQAPGPPGQAGTGDDGEPSAGYVWPTGEEVAVLRGFEPPSAVWGPGHRGVDLELPTGAPVVAAHRGVVAFAGPVVDREVVSVQHEDGIRTTYEPLRPAVAAGEAVAAGQVLGHLAPGHCADLPAVPADCLHWGARTGPDAYIDPLTLLGADVVIRLLPLD